MKKRYVMGVVGLVIAGVAVSPAWGDGMPEHTGTLESAPAPQVGARASDNRNTAAAARPVAPQSGSDNGGGRCTKPAIVANLPKPVLDDLGKPASQVISSLCEEDGRGIQRAAETLRVLAETPSHQDKKNVLTYVATMLEDHDRGSELVVRGRVQVAVHLANPPSSRLRVSFDRDDGAHREAEWDPAVSSELTKTVELWGNSEAKASWRVTTAMAQIAFSQAQGAVILAVRFPDKNSDCSTGQSSFRMSGTYVAFAASAGNGGSAGNGRPLKLEPLPMLPAPALTFSCKAATRKIDFERFAAATAEHGLQAERAFGGAPPVVNEVLSLLAEIAVERGKAGALRVLKQRLVEPVCGDGQSKSGVLLEDVGLKEDTLVFQRACDVLDGLRLEDVLSAGKTLLAAL